MQGHHTEKAQVGMKSRRDGFDLVERTPQAPPDTANPSDSAASFVRGLIYSGELAPGDWLPPLRDLAARLGISVLTLRVALKSLVSEGLIATTRGAQGGNRVSDIATLTRRWLEWMRDNADDVNDLWEFREIVESNMAALAARRRTDEELQLLESAWSEGAADSHTAVLSWNAVFHGTLATASHSPRLTKAMLAARRELFLPVGIMLHKHRADELRDAHQKILEAVRDQKPDRAAAAMAEHIAGTRQMVAEALKEAEQDFPGPSI
jgi:GntR family transcriptional repressor for pyruvate dehydrogenase complex